MDLTLPVLFLFLFSLFLFYTKKYFLGSLFFIVALLGLFFLVNDYFSKRRERKQKKDLELKQKILKE